MINVRLCFSTLIDVCREIARIGCAKGMRKNRREVNNMILARGMTIMLDRMLYVGNM